ncbi:hypothetical protein TCAL_07895, partial [Tigriopus californicus]
HQDSLFLDALQTNVFDDYKDNAEDQDSTSSTRLLTTFIAEVSSGSECLEFQIEHCRSSEVDLVGLQVWRGALLLSDFILAQPQHFKNRHVIELAAGTGLTSIVAAKWARHVLCTDVDRGEILDLIRSNVKLNGCDNVCKIEEINFFETSWRVQLQREIDTAEVVLVADVVYNPEITAQFFNSLQFILDRNPIVEVFLAIEQRCQMNEQGELISPNFDHFCALLSGLAAKNGQSTILKELPCDFPRFFNSYERVKRLHLWHIARL